MKDSRACRYAAFDEVNKPYIEWQLRQFLPALGRRILEIGCGVGSVTDLLGPREWIHSLDIEPDVLDHARHRLSSRPECRFSLLDVSRASEDELAKLEEECFDSVLCVNVLEHIEDDRETLRRLHRLLRPGGRLSLLIPAHPALYGAYDKVDGHFRRYTRENVRTVLKDTGFEIEQLRYFNLVGAIGWWIQYKLLRKTIHGAEHFEIMNRLIPILRRAEKALPPPFGLSVVAIAKKSQTACWLEPSSS